MPRSFARWLPVVAFSMSFAVSIPGCTVLMLNRAIDIRREFPAGSVVEADRIATLVPGARVVVMTRTGHSIRGRFSRAELVPVASHEATYEAWRAAHPGGYPALGEKVRLGGYDAGGMSGRFAGFGWRSVLVDRGDPRRPKEVPFKHFESLRAEPGGSLRTDSLTVLRIAGALPCRSGMRLEAEQWPAGADYPAVGRAGLHTRARVIPADDVATITIRSPGANPAVYVLVGAMGDVLVVLAVRAMTTTPRQPSCSPDLSGWSPLGWANAVPGTLAPANADFDTRTGAFVAGVGDSIATETTEPGDAMPSGSGRAAPAER